MWLDGLGFLHFLLDIGVFLMLTFVKHCLTSTPANVAFKMTDTKLYLIWDITLLRPQLNLPPTPDFRLVSKTVLTVTVTPEPEPFLGCNKFSITTIGLSCGT